MSHQALLVASDWFYKPLIASCFHHRTTEYAFNWTSHIYHQMYAHRFMYLQVGRSSCSGASCWQTVILGSRVSQVKVSAYLSLPLKFRDLENIDRTTRSVNALFDWYQKTGLIIVFLELFLQYFTCLVTTILYGKWWARSLETKVVFCYWK